MSAPQGNVLTVVKTKLDKHVRQIDTLLPLNSGVTPKRLVTLAMMKIASDRSLQTCTPQSIVVSVLRIAQLGLELGDTAHMIAFGNTAQVVVDYRGLVELACRHPDVANVSARLVFANDFFEMDYGTDPKIAHRPALKQEDRGEVVGAYAVIHMKNGSTRFDFMNVDEIEQVRNGRGGPWDNHWGEMAKKTVVRRVLKLAPRTTEFNMATALQDQQEGYPVQAPGLQETEMMAEEILDDTDEEMGDE